MKSIKIKLLIGFLILVSSISNKAGAQGIGGLPDKTFNPGDSALRIPSLSAKNTTFFPAPEAGLYTTSYSNDKRYNIKGRRITKWTQYLNKNGSKIAVGDNYILPFTIGEILETTPGKYYMSSCIEAGGQAWGGVDSVWITKVLKETGVMASQPGKKFFFHQPYYGYYNTGIVQQAADKLAFWLTSNPSDTLLPHNQTFVKLLDSSCAPMPVSYIIPDFKAQLSATYQGNIYLLGRSTLDTLETTTRIVVLNGTTLQPVAVDLSGLSADLLVGKAQVFTILPDGKMVIAGKLDNGQFVAEQVVRLNLNGSVDNSFALTVLTGRTGTRWNIDEQNIIRGASNVVDQGQNLASMVVVLPNGGTQKTDVRLPAEYTISHPLMYHPDRNAFLFETENIVLDNGPVNIYPGSYYSDTAFGTRYRFYVGQNGKTGPIINKDGVGAEYESVFMKVNKTTNKILVAGNFTQVNQKMRPGMAIFDQNGVMDTTFKMGMHLPRNLKRRIVGSYSGENFFLTNSGKVLLSPQFDINYTTSDTVYRLMPNGLLDNSFANPWAMGTLVPKSNGEYLALRIYQDSPPYSVWNPTPSITIKVLKMDSEGNPLGEFGSFNTDGVARDTVGNFQRSAGLLAVDGGGGAWISVTTIIGNSAAKSYWVRIDPNGSSRIMTPGFNFVYNDLNYSTSILSGFGKIEVLPGKRFRIYGAFQLMDTLLSGKKVVNIIETDSLGKLDISVPPKSHFVPNVYGGRNRLYAQPCETLPDGSMFICLIDYFGESIKYLIKLKSNGKQDNSFLPMAFRRSPYSIGVLGDKLYISSYTVLAGQPAYNVGQSKKNGLHAFLLSSFPANTGYAQGRVTQVVSPAVGCNPTSPQKSERGMLIRSTPSGRIALSDTGGYYTLPLELGNHAISQTIENNMLQRQVCPVPPTVGYDFSLATSGTASLGNDFINQTYDCPRLDLQVLQPRFRLCSRSRFRLQYQNDGVAPQPNARVRLNLPQEVRIETASRAFTKDADSSYVFDVGTLQAGQMGEIIINDTVLCPTTPDSLARACYSARIEPLSLCANINPATLLWDGAWLDAIARYNPGLDKVRVVIYNKGTNMADSTSMRLTGPGVIYKDGKIKLAGGDSLVWFADPAITGTIQLQLQQTSACPLGSNSRLNHSGKGTARAFLNFGSGLLETYSVQACPSFRFSYDPNEKLVEPQGEIEPGTELDYTIHFENYGNDTAYAVTVQDTLPQGLDIKTIKPGGSSDTYELEIAGTESNPVLYFHFRDIKLTGKKQDSIRSKGQLSFKIRTKNDVIRGSIISNRAHIYFDRNEAVTTEFVHSPIAQLGTPTEIKGMQKAENRMVIAPNPTRGATKIWFTQTEAGTKAIRIFTLDGKLVREIATTGGQAEIKGLSSGIYVLSAEGVKPQRLIVIQ